FLANMSHEIRTPMNAILGFTELLRRGYDRNRQDAARFLDTIHASGTHLVELINDVLDLSKVEAGQMEMERLACAPHRIAREVVTVLAQRAADKGITLELDAAGALPDTIRTDPRRLRQILTNLAGNAIKFTDAGGIRIVLRLEGEPGRALLAIDVTDTGIGVSPEKLESIFDPFVQADASVTRRFGGTGLGLSISRRFARARGGDIVASSAPGRGSVFRVTIDTGSLDGVRMLDRAEALAESGSAVTQTGARWRLRPARVLVVDDGPENRELVRLVLQEQGLAVEEAENCLAGLDKALAGRYDAVLMDIQMPEMDGHTAARLMREGGVTAPVLALTAHAMKGFEKEIEASGFSGYLTKPVDIDTLVGTLAQALGGERLAAGEAAVTAAENPPAAAPACQAQRDEEPGAGAPRVVSRLANRPRLVPAIRKFAERLGAQLDAMDAALGAGDHAALAGLAHWLKGAAGTVGYDQFTDPAVKLEQLAKAGAGGEIGHALAGLRALQQRMSVPAEPASEPATQT
ncbi:MAG: response regulator, partial [Burkholderiales bacterium]|nr:response regulator [Burkholderiales bacterium]